MNLDKLSEPLTIDQIDFRIQSINKGGYATILAYKDARVDMQRLDEAVGRLNWQRSHTRDNHNCIISIWDDEKSQWVSKEDTGSESSAEKEKGLASDSFKRAGFNWGIGRELYDYPVIQVKLHAPEYKVIPANGNYKERITQTWELKLRDWIWYSEFTDGQLSLLTAHDGSSERFRWGLKRQPVIGDISGKAVDVKKAEAAYKLFKDEIDSDDPDPNYRRMQAANSRLTNDEMQEVFKLFGKSKPPYSTKKQYNTILKECLAMVLDDQGNPVK